jgi:hypothetical protein
VAAPFVAAAPAGARVRTRLRPSRQDEAVLRAVGAQLGSLAGKDLAARCAEGRLDARGRARSRAARKRALTAGSSSRWAGAITRTSEDQVRLAGENQRAQRTSLQARIGRIQARLAVPAGGKAGRDRGYATQAERHAKAVRLQSLRARLARVERQLEAGAVSVVRGGKALLRTRNNLAAAELTELTGGPDRHQRNAAYLHHALAAGRHPRLAELLTPPPGGTSPPEAATDPADRYRDILARILTGLLGPQPPSA